MIIATVNASRILGVIRQFPSTAGVSMDSFLDEQTRLLISSSGNVPGLVQVTPPHSAGVKGSAAKKQGDYAVSGDINQVYATPGKVFGIIMRYAGEPAAARWWKLWKTNPVAAKRWLDLSAPSELLRMSIGWDSGAAHDKARRKDGRVHGRAQVIVLDEIGSLRSYIRKRQKKVGLLAASIPAAVGSRYGTVNGIPSWVKRHSSSYGYVRDRKSSKGRTITLGVTNNAIKEMQRRFTYVLRYRLKAWERQLPYLARKLEKRLSQTLSTT